MYARDDFSDAWQMIADGEKEVADVLAAGEEPDYRYFVSQADACLTHDARRRLGAIRAPTLVLAGDEDAFTPLPLSEALATSIPNATLSVMEGCGHVMFYERPADFNQRVSRFSLHRKKPTGRQPRTPRGTHVNDEFCSLALRTAALAEFAARSMAAHCSGG
jgi:pimeloyl-ACP methyl ester carboxylesterase